MAAWADSTGIVTDSTRVAALDWNWAAFWSNQWTVGIGTGIVVGLVVWYVTERRHRPRADEIAEAQHRQKRKREDEVHAVAAELFDIVGVIRQQSSFLVENLRKQHIPDVGFESVAVAVRERWETVKPKLHVLERNDIPGAAQGLVEKFEAETKRIATDLEPIRAQAQGRRRDLRELTGGLIGFKYEGESLQGQIDPYRLRLHPPR